MSRSRLYTIPTLALVAAMAMACSEQSTAPTSRATSDEGSRRGASKQSVTPASVGWQEQARSLVAANNVNVLAAARIYAALSVAQYRAVMAVQDPDAHGNSTPEGIGAGGRSEQHRQKRSENPMIKPHGVPPDVSGAASDAV